MSNRRVLTGAIPVMLTADSPEVTVPVTLVAGGGSGGTSSADQTAFVAGSTLGTPIMGYDATSGELVVLATVPGSRDLAVTVTAPTSSTTANQAQTTIGSALAVQVLAANASRKRMILQNTGTTRLYVGLGFTPTSSVYSFALPACGNSNDGSSPPWVDVLWTGAVSVIGSATGGTIVASENT